MEQTALSKKLNSDVRNWLKEITSFIFRRPELIPLILKIRSIQKPAEKKRIEKAQTGLHIPPYMILSATHRCNLNCKGCYDKAHKRKGTDMTAIQLDRLLSQAVKIGTSVIITAGGEPFARKDLTLLMAKYQELFFVVFTNGTMLDDSRLIEKIRPANILPIISIEGSRHNTDDRRGHGIYEKTESAMKKLKEMKKHFGLSVTVTTENIDEVLSTDFLAQNRRKGASVLFYIDYVPFAPGTEAIELNEENRIRMLEWLEQNKRKDMLTVAFPGDEKPYGGCLAAGKGFVHIAADGSVEPCPFAPVSVDNVVDIGLENALRSPFLKAVRDNAELLEDESHGCALFHKKEELLRIKENL
jgi:MoaA/NifB/PqqE/SkfB family radical SAM enzyme